MTKEERHEYEILQRKNANGLLSIKQALRIHELKQKAKEKTKQ